MYNICFVSGLTMDKLEKVRVKMQNNRVKCALELNKNVKHEEEKKAFCNSITRSGESQTTVCIPMPRKCTEVDLYIDKNLSIQVSKTATFFSCCSIIICLLISLLLFLVVRYQNSELQMMEQNIMVLKRQVEILAGKSYSLGQNIDIWALKRHVRILAGESYILSQNIDILQDGVNSLMHKQFTTVNVIAHDQDIQHSHGPEDVSNPEMETEQGSNFVSLELDSSSNTDAGLEDTVKSGNVIDVKNRSLYTSDEHSDSLSTNAPLFAFGTPDIMNSIFPANNVASLTSQELKLQNINDSSVPPDGEVLLSAVGSLSSEDVATDEGVRAGRAKRADRRGNQKPSGGRRHLNSQRKNRGTMNFLAFQDA
jgi:hypothetical protein